MVVRDDGRLPCDLARHLQRIVEPACSGDAHRRAVAEAAIRLRLFACQPATEESAVAGARIPPAPALHRANDRRTNRRFVRLFSHFQQGVRHGDRHHRIVRKARALTEQRKILRLRAAVEFIRRTDHIAQNRTIHKAASFSLPRLSQRRSSSCAKYFSTYHKRSRVQFDHRAEFLKKA